MRTVFIALTAAIASAAQAQVVGWWTFEEGVPGQSPAAGPSILDISGFERHGTLTGFGRYETGVASPVALEMPYRDSVIRVPDDPAFELRSGFTLETYIRINRLGSVCCGVRPLLFRGDRRAGKDPWMLAIDDAARPTLAIWDGGDGHVLRSPEPVSLEQWVHVAGTYDATAGRSRLYIDGREVAASIGFVAGPYPTLDPTRSPTVAIGNADTATQGLEGALDSPRITARPLTPAEFLPPIVACRADLDGDGELTFFDFLAFQDAFAAGDPIADFDGDGMLTFFDFLAFQSAFAAGCP